MMKFITWCTEILGGVYLIWTGIGWIFYTILNIHASVRNANPSLKRSKLLQTWFLCLKRNWKDLENPLLLAWKSWLGVIHSFHWFVVCCQQCLWIFLQTISVNSFKIDEIGLSGSIPFKLTILEMQINMSNFIRLLM